MCCAGTDYNPSEIDGECPDCGEETVDGDAYYVCGYSEVICDTCGSAPCNDAC